MANERRKPKPPKKRALPKPQAGAGSLGREHADKTRAKIKSSSLVTKLQNHVLRGTKLSPSQLRAAEILLRKTVPDLQTVEIAQGAGGPVQVNVVHFDGLDD